MINQFMNDDFILSNQTARRLFHDFAKKQPIIDYHCHLQPKELVENRNWENLTQIWLGGDHYKWRLMRARGWSEDYITGNKSDYEKFMAWVDTLQKAGGNPLYEWSHLELRRYFGIDLTINAQNAEKIWELANAKLAQSDFTPRELVAKMRVQIVCTTDDPIDSLEFHRELKSAETRFKVLPSFRPDKAVNVNAEIFPEYISKLEAASKTKIRSFSDLLSALENRILFFKENGCLVSDHGLNSLPFPKTVADEKTLSKTLNSALKKRNLDHEEIEQFRFAVLTNLAALYKKHGIIMQYHFGSPRDFNSEMFKKLGPDTGYDAIGDTQNVSAAMGKLLDVVSSDLPTTIWYSLNPNDWMIILTVMGTFNSSGVHGKQLQHFGSGWWFDDTFSGMTDQITKLAEEGLLGNFVGMLTDSRSFLSYPRHEYFRRVLCQHIGSLVEQGRLPFELAQKMVEDISYFNVKELLNHN